MNPAVAVVMIVCVWFAVSVGLIALVSRKPRAKVPPASCGRCGEPLPHPNAIREHLCTCHCDSLDIHHPSCLRRSAR